LVVIAIIAILIALLVPAVQKVREASNVATCQNNLKQLGLACHNVLDTTGAFPANGWGWDWVGVPSKGYNNDQPGGWAYNLLPFIEQSVLRNLGAHKTGDAFVNDIIELIQTPVVTFNCPTRRNGGPYPYTWAGSYTYYSADAQNAKRGISGDPSLGLARGDYAACVGSQGTDQSFGGIAGGDNVDINHPPQPPTDATGVIFQCSKTRVADIGRGTSHTFLLGERYLQPEHYTTGSDGADNEGVYNGEDNDNSRDTASPPMRDTANVSNDQVFGSAHSGGVNMLLCDGSVQFIYYSVNSALWTPAGNRFTDANFVADPW
jgi:prepilin-type processing-associated H-X9-DG protein